MAVESPLGKVYCGCVVKYVTPYLRVPLFIVYFLYLSGKIGSEFVIVSLGLTCLIDRCL